MLALLAGAAAMADDRCARRSRRPAAGARHRQAPRAGGENRARRRTGLDRQATVARSTGDSDSRRGRWRAARALADSARGRTRAAAVRWGGASGDRRELARHRAHLAAACVFAALCVLLPSIAGAPGAIVDVLRRGVTAPPRDRRLRRVFVTAQIALAFVLLVSVTFLARGWMTLLRTPAGFDANGVMALAVSLPGARYATAAGSAPLRDASNSLQQRLGDRAAAMIDEAADDRDRGRLAVAERPGEPRGEAVIRFGEPRLFRGDAHPDGRGTSLRCHRIRIRAAACRSCRRSSRSGSSAGPAVGRRIWLGAGTQPAEIVGVTGEVKHGALDGPPTPTVYVPSLQVPRPRASSWYAASVRPATSSARCGTPSPGSILNCRSTQSDR